MIMLALSCTLKLLLGTRNYTENLFQLFSLWKKGGMYYLTKVCALHLLCLLCSVDSSRWFTWVVRVGAPSKILRLGM